MYLPTLWAKLTIRSSASLKNNCARSQFWFGDVKYHLGLSSQIQSPSGKLVQQVAPNPSHLESVDPVVEGLSRAKADLCINQIMI
ncbi:MAG: hypothetical protein IPN15_15435, partial [Saprospiraceae bacterium]|nr:hypothetical protein [Candidatus Vicinibacter affinis]